MLYEFLRYGVFSLDECHAMTGKRAAPGYLAPNQVIAHKVTARCSRPGGCLDDHG